MAEHELTKHTVRAVKQFQNKEKKGWEKVKDILLEVAIIVFAITFSLWMHNRSEESHKRENVKQFLLGVKEDLKNDLKEMAGDTIAVDKRIKSLSFIMGKNAFISDSIDYYLSNVAFSYTLLIPNNGRYEGFKSSGQIGYIENKNLTNLIVDHYQEHIPGLIWVSQHQIDFYKTQFSPYINKNLNIDEQLKFKNVESQKNNAEFNMLMMNYRINLRSMRDRYRLVIQSSKDIIAAIDKEDL